MQFFFRQYLHQQECNYYTKEKNMQYKHAKGKDFTFFTRIGLLFSYQYRAPLNERNKFRERVTTCE